MTTPSFAIGGYNRPPPETSSEMTTSFFAGSILVHAPKNQRVEFFRRKWASMRVPVWCKATGPRYWEGYETGIRYPGSFSDLVEVWDDAGYSHWIPLGKVLDDEVRDAARAFRDVMRTADHMGIESMNAHRAYQRLVVRGRIMI